MGNQAINLITVATESDYPWENPSPKLTIIAALYLLALLIWMFSAKGGSRIAALTVAALTAVVFLTMAAIGDFG